MKENEIEQLLEKICREQIEPPEHLVAYTKQKLKRSRFLNVVIFISLFFNTLVTVSAAVVIFLPGLTWVDKILWYFGTTAFFNGLIVFILLNREKVTAFFREFIYAVNHQL
jgi:tellurite resistance protein TehA-like permease